MTFALICALLCVDTAAALSAVLEAQEFKANVVHYFTPFSSIGKKKAGLLCISNGKLIWSDIAPQNPAIVNAFLKTSLVENSPSFVSGNKRVTAFIAELEITACAKEWALGNQEGYKGSGRIVVEWQTETGRGDPPLVTTSCFSLTGTDPLKAAFDSAVMSFHINLTGLKRVSDPNSCKANP